MNDRLVINGWGVPPRKPFYRLTAVEDLPGHPVPIKVESYDTAGPATVSLHWTEPNALERCIPAEAFFLDEAAARNAKPHPITPDQFHLVVMTKTMLGKRADAPENLSLHITLNRQSDERPLLAPGMLKSGMTDNFVDNLAFKTPFKDIKQITLRAAGSNLWACESISFQFFHGWARSKVYEFNVRQVFGTDRKNKLAVERRTFTLDPPPTLSFSN